MSQQIYLPLGGRYPIPYEFEADTMPVPRGHSSVLWELRDGNMTAAQAMIYLCMNHGSTWASGATWPLSARYLSDRLGKGMSHRHVRDTVAKLSDKNWIETIDDENPSGKRYRLRHYLCAYKDVPVDGDGKPLTFAVPRGPGGPIERCFEGDISWKAALAWIFAEVEIQLEGMGGDRRADKTGNAVRTLKADPDILTQLSETHHRVDAGRHAGTADTEIATRHFPVVSDAATEA